MTKRAITQTAPRGFEAPGIFMNLPDNFNFPPINSIEELRKLQSNPTAMAVEISESRFTHPQGMTSRTTHVFISTAENERFGRLGRGDIVSVYGAVIPEKFYGE